jgi:four helix bundle protein
LLEEYARKHRREYTQILRIAFGSGAEPEAQIVIAKWLRLAPESKLKVIERLLEEVTRMLNGLEATLRPKP